MTTGKMSLDVTEGCRDLQGRSCCFPAFSVPTKIRAVESSKKKRKSCLHKKNSVVERKGRFFGGKKYHCLEILGGIYLRALEWLRSGREPRV